MQQISDDIRTDFRRNRYLEWFLPRMRGGEGGISLAASGVPAVGPEFLPADSTADPWSAGPLFEETLASWLGLQPAEVLFAPGATGGSLLALLALVSPGEEVIVEMPVYEPMLRQAERLGPMHRFNRRFDESWRLPLERILPLINDRTGAIMITEPGNPSGTCAEREDVLQLAEIAGRAGAVLLVNEVYRGFGGQDTFHGAADNIVVVSSLSKFFGTYWARVGWLSATPEKVATLRVAHMNFGIGTAPGAMVGSAVMRKADWFVKRARELASSGVDTVDGWVEQTEGVSWLRPEGPGFGAVRLPKGVDDVAFAEHLHDHCGVLVVPGTFFFAQGTLRIAWLSSEGRLEEGLEVVGGELSRL